MTVERGVVFLVGAGPGDPGLLTVRGQAVLGAADCVIYDYLVHPRCLDGVPAAAERIFVGKKGGAQVLDQAGINDLLVGRAGPDRVVVRLKGGDPFCFGRGGEEARALHAAGVPFRIVPGVTSGIAAPAYAGIPVTDREAAQSVTFLTGTDRRGSTAAHDWPALAKVGTLVLYMGVGRMAEIRDALIAAGKPAETPTAAIRWGTWPHQQVLTADLGTLPERLQAAGFSAPAIIVIGEVASWHRELDWFHSGPLAGRTLLVAGAERADPLTLGLETAGARVLALGERVAVATDTAALDAALDAITDWQWIAFASGAAVRHTMERLLERVGDLRALSGIRLAAIGPSCARALQHWHLRPDVMPQVHDSRHLVASMVAVDDGRPGPVLVPGGADGGGSLARYLADAGYAPHQVVAYHQISTTLSLRLHDESVDGVCLASPSAVRRFCRGLDHADRSRLVASGSRFFAIGEATAAAMVEVGLPVHHTAARVATASLVDTVAAQFAPGTDI